MNIRILFLLLWTVLGVGCSKSHIDVELFVPEADRSSEATSLVRKVEVIYKNSSGAEIFREQIPSIGLSQPIAVQSETLNQLELFSGDYFEAVAKSADDRMVLKGVKRIESSDQTSIKILMTRPLSVSTSSLTQGSGMISSLKVVSPDGTGKLFSEGDLKSQGETCIDLGSFIYSNSKPLNYVIELGSPIVAPTLFYYLQQIPSDLSKTERIHIKDIAKDKQRLVVNSLGRVELRLSEKTLMGLGQSQTQRWRVSFFSDQWESCGEFETKKNDDPKKELKPILVLFNPVSSPDLQNKEGLIPAWMNVEPKGLIRIENPNQDKVTLNLSAVSKVEGKNYSKLCLNQDFRSRPYGEIECHEHRSLTTELWGRSSVSFAVYGVQIWHEHLPQQIFKTENARVIYQVRIIDTQGDVVSGSGSYSGEF